MTNSKALARPPQVTMAGWITIVGSVFVVLSVFDLVSTLHSLDTRESAEKALSEPPLDGLGLSVKQALSLLHTLSLVAAGCATAAAILGWYVLHRNKPARIALTLVALPLFLTGVVAGGFVPLLIAVAVVILWTSPASDWFNGIAPQPAARPQPFPPFPPQAPPPGNSPYGDSPYGEPPSSVAPPSVPPVSAQPPAYPAPHAGYGRPQPQSVAPVFSSRRPLEVLRACIVTWVFSGLVLVSCLLTVMVVATDPSVTRDVYDQNRSTYQDLGLSLGSLRAATIAMCVIFALWSVGAIALAVLTFLRHNWARVLLIVSASVSGLLFVIFVAASFAMIVPALAALMTVYLLLRPAAGEWYVRH